MRADSQTFSTYNVARAKSPRFVVRIGFDVDSLAITSHEGITGVTAGTVLEGLLSDPTVTTQRLKPDQAVAEIGSASFALVDVDHQFTDEVRERLLDGAGLRGKQVQFYLGYEGLDFADFQLVATQIISSVTYSDGRYSVACLDIQRSLRTSVFEPVQTTLASTLLETDVVVNLTSVARLQRVLHGSGWSDAPGQEVGYIKVKSEVIRYTAIVGSQLQGCTRGVFNTIPATYVVDPATPAERREKVAEYIYLELPAIKLAYAVLTGALYGNLLGALGGFEVDTNADGIADGWQNYTNTQTYSRVAGHSGTWSQRFQGNGGASPRIITSLGILIPDGVPFTVSAWFNATAGQQLLIGAKGFSAPGGSELLNYVQVSVAASGGWQRISAQAVGDGNYVKPFVGLGGAVAAGTNITVDDVQLEVGGLTDYIEAAGSLLPDHWHLGIAPSLVRLTDFLRIGSDLWSPADDTLGFPLRFEGLTKTDGKRFLETEVYLATGLFSPVYSDGTLGLRRMIRLREDAAIALTLDENNVISCGALEHDMRALHNVFVVNWSWNGSEFRRATSYLDPDSVAKHGEAERLTLNFKGLHGAKHTDGVIFAMLDMYRDRFAGPPQRITVEVLPSLNRLEVGDVVRLRIANVRDYAARDGATIAMNRAMEIQNVSTDYRGAVSLELFGSTADPNVESPTVAVSSLPDSFYTAAGTNLSAVAGVVIGGNTMTAAPVTPLAGNAVLTNGAAVYYHNGDLTIGAGVNLLIADNVQLRVKGFLTVNGSINGVGRGLAGVADDGRALYVSVPSAGDVVAFGPYYESIPGQPGYVGSTRAFDGVLGVRSFPATTTNYYNTRTAAFTQSLHPVAPRLMLAVSGSTLLGLPSDLRGSGGAPGGRAQQFAESTRAVIAPHLAGGTGGNGGAGLAIICRGMAFGANGFIDLSGANTASPAAGADSLNPGFSAHPGAGAPGGPGTLIVLLDGGSLSVPDLAGNKYRAKVGTATISGTPLPRDQYNFFNHSASGTSEGVAAPASGYADPDFVSINALDMSGAALLIQHIPAVETVVADQESVVAPPSALSTESAEQSINVTITQSAQPDTVELYMSSTNDRTNATKVFDGLASVVKVRVPDGVTRYFWARNKLAGRLSTFFPASSVAGVSGSSIGGLICRGNCEAYNNGVRKNGGAANWDSDAYSPESFADGVFVSFQAAQTNLAFMVGLNNDPDTDSSFTSLNYAWYCRADGTLQIYESGVAQSTFGAYTTSTTLQIKYDGQNVIYLKDGVAQRAVPISGQTLFVDSSFNGPGATLRNLKYGALTPSPSSAWTVRGRCIVHGNTITKVGGSATFDSDCYSTKAFPEGCFLSFQAAQTTAQIAIGLNTDPSTDTDRASIDYCFFLGSGTVNIFESGTLIAASVAAYTTSTVLSMRYDGQQVQYLVDNVVVRTVQLRGAILFMDSAFSTPGGSLRNVEFSPLTPAPTIPWNTRGLAVATATTAKKISGAAGWDADVYSLAAYRGGCAVTGIADTAAGGFMIGLEDNPAAGTDYTHLDFAFFCNPTSTQLQVYESGVLVSVGALTFDTTTHLAIVYDGHVVRYLRNGVIVRERYSPDRTFYGRAALRDAGATVRALSFAPLSGATPVPFISRSSQVLIGPTSARKLSTGTNAWDADFISVQGHPQANIQFKATQINAAVVVGLNSDPYTDASYTSIDAGWHMKADASLEIYESGVAVTGFGTYTTSTVLAITYDGTNARYYKDGVLQRTTAMAGLTMFADASLYTAGAGIAGLQFGPGSVLPQIETIEIAPFGVTEVLSLQNAGVRAADVIAPALSGQNTFEFLSYLSRTPVEIEAKASFTVRVIQHPSGAAPTAPFTAEIWFAEQASAGGPGVAGVGLSKTSAAVERVTLVSRFTYAGGAFNRYVNLHGRITSDGTQTLRLEITQNNFVVTVLKR